jgi:DNA-binding transcriptional LysR family regulator
MQLSGIDMNLLVALQALLVHRCVTRAGREIGLSQSSMSHALARLRAHFKDSLLVPVGRELVLSERAKNLIEPVADAIARLERVFGTVEPFDPTTSRRRFRIASTDCLALCVLPQLAAILQQTAPGIEVRVCALHDGWIGSLERGDLDLKLGPKCPQLPTSFESQDLLDQQLACVVRGGHTAPAKLSVREYAQLDHLVVAPTGPASVEPSDPIDEVLERQGLKRRIIMTVPHFMVAPFVVASSDVVLTAPERVLSSSIKSLGLRRLELPLKLTGYTLSQVWAARANEDEAHHWLRATIAGLLAPSK